MSKDIKKIFKQYITYKEKFFDGKTDIKVTTFGVTTLLFDDGKTQILFDAMVTRPSFFKAFLSKIDSDAKLVRQVIEQNQIDRLKGIFISHTHYDHVLDMPSFAKLTGATVYGTASTLNVAKGNGVKEEKLAEFKAGDEFTVGDFEVKIIRALHSAPNWYNNDLGQTVDKPVTFPTSKKELKEGGSYDFIIKHGNLTFVIHPSCNYIENTFNDIKCDVLFFCTGMLSKMTDEQKDTLYKETVAKLTPKTVIPIHWDNFLLPLKKSDYIFSILENGAEGMGYLIDRLHEDNIEFKILLVKK